MSAVWRDGTAAPAGPAHLLFAWRSLRWQEFGGFALAGLLFGMLDLSALLEIDVGDRLQPLLLRHLLLPVLGSLILLLVWLPADRSAELHPRRRWRLALSVLLGSGLAMATIYGLMLLLPGPSMSELLYPHKVKPQPGVRLASLIGDTLWICMPAAMMVSMLELLRRRRRSEISLQGLLHEHSQLKRRAMAARLAALQAQVEPELLFDALVDIEQAYGRSDAEAAAQMELLIRHLRVALPRLRDAGSSLESEAELLSSYLGVLQGLRKTPMRLQTHWPEQLHGASLPPMLLLPLLQRALRLAEVPPSLCTLNAEPFAGGMRIELGFDRPGLCGADAELQNLSERLRTLWGGPAQLRCQSMPDSTLFTLELPA